MAHPAVAPVILQKVRENKPVETHDLLAVEEPLEIRIGYGPETARLQKSLVVTMRTPGHDFELALGFLFAEGVIQDREQVLSVGYCQDAGRQEKHNLVRVELAPGLHLDLQRLQRNFYSTSSCGVCGKTAIDAVRKAECPSLFTNDFQVPRQLIPTLSARMLGKQAVFACTGGLHAAGLFDGVGNLLLMREDVGRHNALDKLIGAAWYDGEPVLGNSLALMSGRIGFELVQKCLKAGIPILAAVGAPSSLAVELARNAGMTLLGFVREGSFNVYTGAERLV